MVFIGRTWGLRALNLGVCVLNNGEYLPTVQGKIRIAGQSILITEPQEGVNRLPSHSCAISFPLQARLA